MTVGEMQKVDGPHQLHPSKLDEVDREERCNGSKRERADNTVSKRLALLDFRKSEDQNRQHHRVVGAQQSFEGDQERDGEKVGRLNQSPCLER